ncbi:tumor necrosis factor receptor superfamily member 1A [Pungitius pungitius]|uniref:tumor necrosis factor receptor superfamily member 1A n=1 Tax=Pungitius pungitius TaxID=134920 RepID=UPI002E115D5E
MDLVLAMVLVYIFTGQSKSKFTTQQWDSCSKECPAGSYVVGDCDHPDRSYRCQICRNFTFTDVNNTVRECERCNRCHGNEEEIKPCTTSSNAVCVCKDGYYRDPRHKTCLECNCEEPVEHPGYTSCRLCKKCLKATTTSASRTTTSGRRTSNNISGIAEGGKPCTTSSDVECVCKDGYYVDPQDKTTCLECDCSYCEEPVPPGHKNMCQLCKKCLKSRTTTTTTSGTTTPTNISVNQTSWELLVLVPVTLLLFLWLMLLLARSPIGYPDSCLCWGVNKSPQPPLEDPDSSEQSVPSDTHPDTLTLNICENTPMMTLSHSPSVPEHPVHISPLDCEPRAKGQHGSDRWPAIVLYAIIREVPLRRWKEFLRLLSLTDQQLERVELEAGLGLGSMEKQYQMLRLWSQCSSATLNDVFSALHYMDLSGCAQQLKESLEKQQFAGLK